MKFHVDGWSKVELYKQTILFHKNWENGMTKGLHFELLLPECNFSLPYQIFTFPLTSKKSPPYTKISSVKIRMGGRCNTQIHSGCARVSHIDFAVGKSR